MTEITINPSESETLKGTITVAASGDLQVSFAEAVGTPDGNIMAITITGDRLERVANSSRGEQVNATVSVGNERVTMRVPDDVLVAIMEDCYPVIVSALSFDNEY